MDLFSRPVATHPPRAGEIDGEIHNLSSSSSSDRGIFMGLDILDLVFRLERRFGIKINRAHFFETLDKNNPPDILVGELFDSLASRARHAGVIDDELDADFLWASFQADLSDSTGVEEEEVTKEKWLLRDLCGGRWS